MYLYTTNSTVLNKDVMITGISWTYFKFNYALTD